MVEAVGGGTSAYFPLTLPPGGTRGVARGGVMGNRQHSSSRVGSSGGSERHYAKTDIVSLPTQPPHVNFLTDVSFPPASKPPGTTEPRPPLTATGFGG